MRDKCAADYGAGLHRDRTHVPVIGIVAVRVMQADVDAKVDLVILRVPPTGVNDLICIRRGVDRSIGDPIIDSVMTIVIHPGA